MRRSAEKDKIGLLQGGGVLFLGALCYTDTGAVYCAGHTIGGSAAGKEV